MRNLITILLTIGMLYSAQAQTTISFKDKAKRTKVKTESKHQKRKKSELIINVADNYSSDQSITIELKGQKKIYQTVERVMFDNGFKVYNRKSVDTREKITKRGGLLEEGEIAIGKTEQYQSNYILTIRVKKSHSAYSIGGAVAARLATLGTAGNMSEKIKPNSKIKEFELLITDVSNGGQIVARAEYIGKAVDFTGFITVVFSELKNNINLNNK